MIFKSSLPAKRQDLAIEQACFEIAESNLRGVFERVYMREFGMGRSYAH
jgi:hypothetical protein